MGTGISVPKETITMGRANRNAPNLYRLYDVPDHLYPYETKKSAKARFPDIELALALEAFNANLNCNLNLQTTKSRLSTSEVAIFKTILNPVKSLQNGLLSGTDAKDFKLEICSNDTNIYMCRNYLVELNEIVSKYTSVTTLQICCNYLRYLPYGISHLKGLKMLIASRNRISELPEEIGLCRELREIDVSCNLLRRLPKSFVCLKKLNTLHVGNNRLTEIPAFLGKIQSLKYLNLSNNKIRSVPFEIFKLPFLLSLNCTGCPLYTKNKRTFEEKGTLTLLETLGRNIIRKNMPVRLSTDKLLAEYIVGVQECSFCGGPFFDYCISVRDFHMFESEVYPIHYKMCSHHYKKHEDRLTTLFERTVPTFPTRLFEDNLPSVCELFEPHGYDLDMLKNSVECAQLTRLIPLICLTLHNGKYRSDTIDSFFNNDHDNSNIFDYIFDQQE